MCDFPAYSRSVPETAYAPHSAVIVNDRVLDDPDPLLSMNAAMKAMMLFRQTGPAPNRTID